MLFGTQVQGHTARDEHLYARTAHQQVGHKVGCREHLLKIIEEQQVLLVLKESAHLLRERVMSLFTEFQRLRHRLWDERWIT